MRYIPQDLALLNQLRDDVAKNATEKGFRAKMFEGLTQEQIDGPVGKLIMAGTYTSNQHGESSEFWEAFRKGTLNEPCEKAHEMIANGLPGLTCAEEEIADEIIRALDKAEAFGVDVAKAVATKFMHNRGRAYLHGDKKA